MPAFEKGSSLKSSYAAVRAEIGDPAWERVLASLDESDREIVAAPEKHTLVPTAVTGRLYSAVHTLVCAGDRVRTERVLRRAGRRDADDMLDGVFSVFARFVSPHQAFKRAGGIISSVYVGVAAETTEDPDGLGGTVALSGMEDEPFTACLVSGWIERAIERFGARNPSVRERAWDGGKNGASRLEFVLRWEE